MRERLVPRVGRIEFEWAGNDHVIAYFPTKNLGIDGPHRVTYVGTIEKRGGKWLWELSDKSDAGLELVLAMAQKRLIDGWKMHHEQNDAR